MSLALLCFDHFASFDYQTPLVCQAAAAAGQQQEGVRGQTRETSA